MNYDINTAEGTNMAFVLDVIFDAAFNFDKVQSDYEQDNPLEMDYIKNKPNLEAYVKYIGASQNVDLGEHSLETTSVIYKETPPTTKVPLQRYYDEASNTTKFVRPDGGETNDNQEIGGEFTNVDSIALVEKTLVSAVPLAGNRKGMARLDISSKASVENFLGMITVPSIPINGKGLVTFTGEVDANTFGLLENAQIYAGVTPGTWSLTPPAKGYYTVIVGTVVVSANNGKVFLKPRVLPKLNDLSDVNNNALEGQPIVKKADHTWEGSDTLKIEKVIPPSGTHTVEGNQTVSATQTAKDFSGETLGLSGKATINEIESTTGFKKTGATNSDLLTGAGGKLSITTLKSGVYQLFNPNNTQVVLEVNAAGEVLIHGPIVQTGTGHQVDFEKVTTKEQLVELRHGATTGMAIGDLAGFIIKLYDGVNDGMIVIDKDGIMRIGDVGDLQPLLTREEAPTNNAPLFFNESTRRAETVKSTDTKVSVVDADAILLKDSQDNNKPKWWSIASIKSTLASYFDTFYLRLADVTQTVAGKITFSKSPVVPNPVSANEALNKETADNTYVPKDGATTINDVKTFTSSPLVPSPTSNNAATPKVYVDAETNAVLTLAQKYAENPEDVEVVTGEYSAKHYSLKAAQSAQSINESADMLIRHESEISSIENIINSANLNQETTATATGVDTIALPKTAANGGMQVQLFGRSAQNLVVNGDFRDGTVSPWYISDGRAALAYESGRAKVTPNNTNQLVYVRNNVDMLAGNIYWYAFNFQTSDLSKYTGNGYFIATPIPNASPLVNGLVSNRISVSTAGIVFRISFSAASVAEMPVFYLDNIRIINLTATFGAGNEPTKEQCDLLFANYFEGSDNVLGTGRIRSVNSGGLNPSYLYFNGGQLRSNGTTKDEIRKGTNGYELIKRVGVGTLTEKITNAADREFSSDTGFYNKGGATTIADGVAHFNVTNANALTRINLLTIGKWYKWIFEIKSRTSGSIIVGGITGSSYKSTVGVHFGFGKADSTSVFLFGAGETVLDFDNFSIKEVTEAEAIAATSTFTELGSNVHYTLATPVITPISHAGLLNSNSNGTVYFEPVIADAGVYGSNIAIQLTDYPIASFESIRKYSGGTYTELNTATAVIASGGLSFTHPDLTAGDLVMFAYSYANESIGRSMILSYAISNSNPYYNVTNSVPLTTGFYTSTTARAAVPEGVRKTGLILTYETAAGVWYTERYIGTVTDTTSFTTAGNWEIGVLRIASVTDTTEYAEITI